MLIYIYISVNHFLAHIKNQIFKIFFCPPLAFYISWMFQGCASLLCSVAETQENLNLSTQMNIMKAHVASNGVLQS